MRAPRGWMAKSTMVVVPPKAAARVPVRKSSALIVPPKGMSRWVWQSMPPGRTYMPVASMTLAAELAGMAARTSLMSSPSMRTSAAMVWVAVTTLPLRIRVFIGVLGVGEMGIQRRGAENAEKAQSACHGRARGGMGWETAGLILPRSRGDTEEDAERQKERENLARSQRRFRCQAARRARQSKTGQPCCLAHVAQPRRVKLDISSGVREREVVVPEEDSEEVGGDLLLIECLVVGLIALGRHGQVAADLYGQLLSAGGGYDAANVLWLAWS